MGKKNAETTPLKWPQEGICPSPLEPDTPRAGAPRGGGVQIRPAADPATGVNATRSCCPLPRGFTAQHPLPSWLQEGPPDSPKSTSLRLGQEGGLGGGNSPAPSHSLPFFKSSPTTIGSVRKLIVYKYPKLRQVRKHGGGDGGNSTVCRLGRGRAERRAGCGGVVPLSLPGRKGCHTPAPKPCADPSPSLSAKAALLPFLKK